MLHHDGRWTHEGQPIRNARLRAAFDRGVRYLPDEGKFVVQLGRFRGQIEVEEAAFFVRAFDLAQRADRALRRQRGAARPRVAARLAARRRAAVHA